MKGRIKLLPGWDFPVDLDRFLTSDLSLPRPNSSTEMRSESDGRVENVTNKPVIFLENKDRTSFIPSSN
jgi:hypothetical protein